MLEGSGTDVEDCVSRTVDSDLNENSEDGRVIPRRAVFSKLTTASGPGTLGARGSSGTKSAALANAKAVKSKYGAAELTITVEVIETGIVAPSNISCRSAVNPDVGDAVLRMVMMPVNSLLGV